VEHPTKISSLLGTYPDGARRQRGFDKPPRTILARCFRRVCFHLEMKAAGENTKKLARDKICALTPGVNSHETKKNFPVHFWCFVEGWKHPAGISRDSKSGQKG